MTELTFLDQIWAWEFGVFTTKMKKWHESTVFLREWMIFLTKYGHESCLFLENGRFLTKYGLESSNFLWEIGQKASYWLLWPIMAIIDCSFERIDVFFTNHVHESRGLFMKILKKMTWRHRVLRDWTFFWTKYGYESYMFFREWTKIWAREQWFFRKKIEKGIYDFFCP